MWPFKKKKPKTFMEDLIEGLRECSPMIVNGAKWGWKIGSFLAPIVLSKSSAKDNRESCCDFDDEEN